MNTENVNPNSKDFDKKSTLEMLDIINNEDKTVAEAVEKCIPQIASAVEDIVAGIKKGGRMIYVGAGTSGRLAIQDAAECTVTYGVKKGTVTAIMAGGRDAVFSPSENVEDDFETGCCDITKFDLTENDSVVGISASGNAEYVCGALDKALKSNANTVAILCNAYGKITEFAKHSICISTGAEVISGSTRMKAGTAQKMVLNMLSTVAMVKLGKVSGNFMTWMKPTNKKLKKRARFIVSELCGVSEEEAEILLAENNNEIQTVVEKFKKDSVIKINDKFMTGSMYAPFCRTKHAPTEEWDNDMKNMAELGYTCLHGFAEWHDIEYEKGHFDFKKIDYFVECAVKNNLVPIINIATQNSVGFYSPRWLMEEYRGVGEGFVDSMGAKQTQSEYVIPCLDDPVYEAYAHRFLKEVAKHFAGDERVGAYVIWGEPNIYSPVSPGASICYCTHTKEKFRRWLKEKYKNIEELNKMWGNEGPSDYIDFCQVNPPTGYNRQNGGFNSWDDWREFMESNLAGHIKEANRIFKQNGALQPTITEMLPGINNGIDPWKIAETSDIVGISLFGKPNKMAALYMTVSDSIAKANGKSTFVVEAGGGAIKFDNPTDESSVIFTPSAEELKTTLLMRAGFGTKGVMFWCWRPRLSDMEGNDFGMCRPDGKPLAKTCELGEFAKQMNSFSSLYNSCERKSQVAIFMSQSINHIMKGEKMTDSYVNSLIGANYMMTDLHINSDFISDKEIIKGKLEGYKVLILPCTYIISEECAKKINEFVKCGGHVIADYILAEKKPGGLCYTELPGAGLDKVFGIEREDVLSISHPVMEKENTYGISKGNIIEKVILNGAKSIEEEYLPGYYMVTQNNYGDGRATYITTNYFANYTIRPLQSIRERILEHLSQDGIVPYLVFDNEDNKNTSPLVTSALYNKENIKVITVTNTDYYNVSDTMTLCSGEYEFIKKPQDAVIIQENGKTKIKFTLGALESFAVYKK